MLDRGFGVWNFDRGAMEVGGAIAGDGGSSAEEQEKWLADAIALVQHNAFYMHRALVASQQFSRFPSFRNLGVRQSRNAQIGLR